MKLIISIERMNPQNESEFTTHTTDTETVLQQVRSSIENMPPNCKIVITIKEAEEQQ